jgi:hypothetical protein
MRIPTDLTVRARVVFALGRRHMAKRKQLYTLKH